MCIRSRRVVLRANYQPLGLSLVKAIRRFTVRTVLPESLAGLEELATNLRWSWHEPTRQLFARVSPKLWEESGHDPIGLLGEVEPTRLDELASDHDFVRSVSDELAGLHAYLTEPRWYQSVEGAKPEAIGYFSPEFGIAAALPQYSGGLGILAGDHLKSASDLGVPIIGVGLFYRSGYFAQAISADGWQQESYPVLDPDGLPLRVLRHPDGTAAHVVLALPHGRALYARVWQVAVGRIRLLLLDTDIPENDDELRTVTDRLYGGGGEHRLLQELLLGVGGVRAIKLLTELTDATAPAVFHTNEGHAGFLGLERISDLIAVGLSFDEALQVVRAGTVFTTHTPVPAGIDRFDASLIRQYFSTDLLPGVNVDDVLQLGAENYPGGTPGTFNMAVMGLRLGQRANGVSQLHGEVSRGMFGQLWPGFDTADVPITSVTNGVHAPTWTDPALLGARVDPARHDGHHRRGLGEPGRERQRPVERSQSHARPARAGRPSQSCAGPGRAEPGHDHAALGVGPARPERAHHRLRPPGAHIQAAHPHAARRDAPSRAAHVEGPARSRSSSPVSRTRRTRRASG